MPVLYPVRCELCGQECGGNNFEEVWKLLLDHLERAHPEVKE